MCGIAGILDAAQPDEALRTSGHRMADALAHRGPDDSGVWVERGVVLAHRRLAIIDPSADGHQPMISSCGRYALTYNGEIYNFVGIRRKLEAEGVVFVGRSDTEVLLEAIASWGIDAALSMANGMFALGLWDREARVLSLARDRFGEKPLYAAVEARRVVFGSELKTLRAAGHPCEVDRDAIRDLLAFGYVPCPASILSGVMKLRAGEIVEIAADPPLTARHRRYWAPPTGAWREATDREELVRELDALVTSAVGLRMVADVPLGAFLSGGVDSSLVVAVMQQLSDRPVKTFTIGFSERAFDEAPFARAIAAHLQTDHTELYVSPSDSLDVIPRLADIYDEPFADMSQIPTSLVSTLARRSVTVALSGDGGDELFGGYDRYGIAMDLTRRLGRVPDGLRRLAAAALVAAGPSRAARVGRPAYRLARGVAAPPDLGHKAMRLAELLRAGGDRVVYDGMMRHWSDPHEVVIGATAGGLYGSTVDAVHGFVDWMMRADLAVYLPDDILVKVDRAAMAASLETRMPLLDPALATFALELPPGLRRSRQGGKALLADVLGTKIPRALFERPKMGFGVPMDEWLRGPLREWAEALLSPGRLATEGFLRPDVIRQHWSEHLSGTRNWQYPLWDVLMFQAWLDRWQR
jgi:asparagine synthase (glutamine-hydrolysing)